jgi:hypothetical protein
MARNHFPFPSGNGPFSESPPEFGGLHASSKYPHDITEVRKNGFYHFFNFQLSAMSLIVPCSSKKLLISKLETT